MKPISVISDQFTWLKGGAIGHLGVSPPNEPTAATWSTGEVQLIMLTSEL